MINTGCISARMGINISGSSGRGLGVGGACEWKGVGEGGACEVKEAGSRRGNEVHFRCLFLAPELGGSMFTNSNFFDLAYLCPF